MSVSNPCGITHNFVTLTNTKTRTVFVPFGLLIGLATLRVTRRFLTLTDKQACRSSSTVLVIPGGITHRFLALTNKQVNLLAVRARHCGPRGTRQCFALAPPLASLRGTKPGKRSTRVCYFRLSPHGFEPSEPYLEDKRLPN